MWHPFFSGFHLIHFMMPFCSRLSHPYPPTPSEVGGASPSPATAASTTVTSSGVKIRVVDQHVTSDSHQRVTMVSEYNQLAIDSGEITVVKRWLPIVGEGGQLENESGDCSYKP